MKYCEYCSNSFVNGIDPLYDGSSLPVGKTKEDNSYRMSIDAAGMDFPPVTIRVTVWNNDAYYHGQKGCNVDVAKYAPKYCPECGRRIYENDKYRSYLKK